MTACSFITYIHECNSRYKLPVPTPAVHTGKGRERLVGNSCFTSERGIPELPQEEGTVDILEPLSRELTC